MLYIIAVVAILIAAFIAFLLVYGHISRKVTRAYFAQPEGPKKLVIRTDGLFPVLGEKPPEEAMWRVKTGMYSFEGRIFFTYRYDPKKLDLADLDHHENIEAGIREMEAEGKLCSAHKETRLMAASAAIAFYAKEWAPFRGPKYVPVPKTTQSVGEGHFVSPEGRSMFER